jgi:hypothetical protein
MLGSATFTMLAMGLTLLVRTTMLLSHFVGIVTTKLITALGNIGRN